MAGGGGSGEPGDGFAPFRFTANQSPMPFGGFDTGLDTGMCTSLHKSCLSGDTKSFSLYTVLAKSMELYKKNL